ncbi:hypothetical protein COM95_04110 [Bacillus cereus]|uniref:hypothetical protein n=1 Tax=Bacillus mycoides TaxID=1405 RepID=UPI000BECD504|nr:hypothetical protein [Bacillus mycoides]MED0943691.1 hypothetical protein [Bacillus mycoides]PEB82835.1 hypothetical protein COM95_04110 [Bacillus cereus]PFH80452.1 hypothetical protein COI61_03915 [Bacillus cereus]PFJ81440.1 hypothetical protein COI95_08725 [Bacillus cereus]
MLNKISEWNKARKEKKIEKQTEKDNTPQLRTMVYSNKGNMVILSHLDDLVFQQDRKKVKRGVTKLYTNMLTGKPAKINPWKKSFEKVMYTKATGEVRRIENEIFD